MSRRDASPAPLGQPLEHDFQRLWERLLHPRRKESLLAAALRKAMARRPNDVSQEEFRDRTLCYLSWKLFREYRLDGFPKHTPTEWWAEVRHPKALLTRLADQAAKDVVKSFVAGLRSGAKPKWEWLENEERPSTEEHDPLECLLYFLDHGLLSPASRRYRAHVRVCAECQGQLQEAAEQLADFTDCAGYQELSLECVQLIRKLGLKECATRFLLASHCQIDAIEDLRDRLERQGVERGVIWMLPEGAHGSEDVHENPEESKLDGDLKKQKIILYKLQGRHRLDEEILERTLRLLGYRGSSLYLRRISENQHRQICRFVETVMETATLWLLIRRDTEITSSDKTITLAAQPHSLDGLLAIQAMASPDAEQLLKHFARRR